MVRTAWVFLLALLALLACSGTSTLDGGADAGFDAGFDAGVDAGTDSALDAEVDGLRALGWWGGLGTDPGLFIEPSSVELDSDGFVYVAGHEDRFQKFSVDGELVGIYGMPGLGDGEFNHPHGLAVGVAAT